MKKLLAIAAAVIALTGSVCAQVAIGTANLANTLYASNFTSWNVPTGNNGPYSWSSSQTCTSATSGGTTFKPFTAGSPIRILDTANPSLSETVTVTAVNIIGSGCSITTTTPANPHYNFELMTATAGLQEAINYARATFGNQSPAAVVILTPAWSILGGTTSMVTSAQGSTAVSVLDLRQSCAVAYNWNGSAYVGTSMCGGSTGCTTAGITAGDVLFPGSTGTCLGSDNISVNSVAGGANGADTMVIQTPSTQTGDVFNLELDSAVDPNNNESLFGPHLWEMDCTNSGTSTLGCQIHLDTSDSGVPASANGGLMPIWIQMKATQSGTHPAYTGIEIDQSMNNGLATTANMLGVVVNAPLSGFAGDQFANVYGYAANLPGSGEAAATGEEIGYLASTTLGYTPPANYCDFVGRIGSLSSGTVRESLGCGPNFASTFKGQVAVPQLAATTLYSGAGTQLPACAVGIKGTRAVVSDATTPTYMGAYTSGGSVTAEVICSYNGTTYSWLTH